MIRHDRRGAPLEPGQVRQELRKRRARRADGLALQSLQGIDTVLRGLHRHAVVHAVLRVQPEIGRGIGARGKGGEQRAGDVPLAETNLGGSRAIDTDQQRGRVDDLVHVDVDHTGHLAHPRRDLAGQRIVRRPILPHDLDVDRRRQAEIEDLADNVPGLKEEGRVRELLGQFLAERLHVGEGRAAAVGLQCHQDLAVGRADGRAVAEGEVDAARGESDVVEDEGGLVPRDHPLDADLDRAEELVGLLDARARRRANVKPELSGIHLRKEVLAGESGHPQRHAHEAGEGHKHGRPVSQRPAEHAAVAVPKRLEAPVERAVESPEHFPAGRLVTGPGCVPIHLARQQIAHHGRDQRAREEVRRQHREHHGEGQRDEEKLHDAAQEDHRDEHNANRQRRHERGDRDLLGPVQNGRDDLLALGEIPVDVLELHRGVVDEDAHGEGQASQRHDVDRVAHRAQHDQGRQDGQRNRRRDDQRAPPTPEEQQDHQRGERSRERSLAHHAVDRSADEDGLIEELAHLEFRRQRGLNLRQDGLDALHDVERRGASALENG